MSNKIVDNFWIFWENRAMIWGKQRIGEKKIKECESILGMPVQSAFANGPDLPHYVIFAFTSSKDAYLVNTKERHYKQYLADGKFLLTRPTAKIKVWTPAPDNSPETKIIKDGEEAERYLNAKQVAEQYFERQGRRFQEECRQAADARAKAVEYAIEHRDEF